MRSTQFLGLGSGRVTLLPSGFAAATSLSILAPKTSVSSGAMTAGTWKTLLSVTGGSSRLNALMFTTADATSRTVDVRITIDGTVVYTGSETIATASAQRACVGHIIAATSFSLAFQPVDAVTSLLIEYRSSLTEADKLIFQYNHEVRG